MLIPVLLRGGTEMQALHLVRVLVSAGCRVTVVCYYEHDASVADEFRSTGAEVRIMGLRRTDGLLHLVRRLLVVLREVKPDIAHVQYVAPGLAPIIAVRLAGVRQVFATVHQPGRPYGRKPRMLIRLAARLCDRFSCVSSAVAESWFGARRNGRRILTICNAVDTERIGRLAAEAPGAGVAEALALDGKAVIGVVSRLRREKGVAVLLEAMRGVLERVPNAILLVVGDGPDRPVLEAQAQAAGIAGHVRWLGMLPPDETFRLLGLMNVVAVPSLYEGFGLSAAEAMAAGRPVVASAVDGLVEVVEDGVTGYLVPPGDSGALASKIVELLVNPERAVAMGQVSQRRAREHFSLRRYAVGIKALHGLSRSDTAEAGVRL
ncbi:MAG: glycosyltransferase [Acidobacteriota bacterium]